MTTWLGVLQTTPGQAPGGEQPDDELVARARRDRQAFGELYRRYLGPVYGYCYRHLGSREAAEDATSQVFCQALRALPTCETGAFRSWLFAIAHNAVVDALRRRRPQQPLDAAGEVADRSPNPEELALRTEDGRAIRRALAQLTPEQQRVVELRLAGLSGLEIAQALGKSHAAVKMLQLRALERLRALLVPPSTGEVRDAGE